MAALALTITDAGRAAIVNAQNTGTGPVVISEIAFGSGLYVPSEQQEALQAEIKRIATFGAEVVAADTIHVTVTDESADTYTLGEFGLFTDSGVLFAVFSQAEPILEKAAAGIALLSVDVLLTSVEAGSVTIGGTEFMLPPATTTRQGVVELADDAETQAGTDATRAVTPKGLASRTATETRAGLVELATPAEAKALVDALRAITPAALQAVLTDYIKAASTAQAGIVELATNEEAAAMQDAARAVTPAALAAALAGYIKAATTTQGGIVELATDAEVQAGTDTVRAVTPAGLASFPESRSTTGYMRMPGGMILQWWTNGYGGSNGSALQTFNFPIAFPSACLGVVSTVRWDYSGSHAAIYHSIHSWTRLSVTFAATVGYRSFWAIGY